MNDYKKAKCVIVGNCQAAQLRNFLLGFEQMAGLFEFEKFPAVHVATEQDVKNLHAALRNTNLLLAQPVTEEYRGRIGLGTNTLKALLPLSATTITWPSLYFDCYNPELFYLKDTNLKTVTRDFDYHHIIIFNKYIEGKTISETEKVFNNDDSQQTIPLCVKESINRLKIRESELDVKSVPYIEEYYQKKRLFWTFNHPCASVLNHIASKIIELMDLQQKNTNDVRSEILNNTIYPILQSVKNHLKLQFECELFTIRLRGQEFTIRDAIHKYYTFYDDNFDLIEFNASLLKNKMASFGKV